MIPPPRRRSGPPPRRINLAELRLNPDKPNLKIPIQDNLFGHEEKESESKRSYTTKITAPLYKPSGIKPNILNLIDKHKTDELLRHIYDSREVSDEEKLFLIEAAKRHNVFYYNKIANYYAQSSPAMQRLMEESALVIIDFDAALQRGFVRYTNEIAKIYAKEHEQD